MLRPGGNGCLKAPNAPPVIPLPLHSISNEYLIVECLSGGQGRRHRGLGEMAAEVLHKHYFDMKLCLLIVFSTKNNYT